MLKRIREHILSLAFSRSYRTHRRLKLQLRTAPRYQKRSVQALGYDLTILDANTFLPSFREIFVDEIYAFNSERAAPRVIDGGGNMGLFTLYVKQNYPEARITAFEPDPEAFATLRRNLDANGAGDVEVLQQALWDEHTALTFHREGSDSGRVHSNDEAVELCEVEAVCLQNYLHEPIDFLKLDIEGAEVRVLLDIADKLRRVRNIFVEYHSFAGETQHLADVLGVIERAGFRMQVHPVYASPQPFIEVKSRMKMDLQLNIFGWREDS